MIEFTHKKTMCCSGESTMNRQHKNGLEMESFLSMVCKSACLMVSNKIDGSFQTCSLLSVKLLMRFADTVQSLINLCFMVLVSLILMSNLKEGKNEEHPPTL